MLSISNKLINFGLLYITIAMASGFLEAEDTHAATQSDLILEESEKILANGISNFGQKLHPIISGEGKYNVIFSPLSIHTAISMVSVGVESGSPSEMKLLSTLGYKKMTSKNSSPSSISPHDAYANVMKHFKAVTESSEKILKESNSSDLWATNQLTSRPPVLDFWTMGIIDKTDLKQPFRETLQTKYSTSVKQVGTKDEANIVSKDINKWGSEAGFGGELVKPDELLLEPGNLILLSAVRIQGWWLKNLREQQIDDMFYNLGDKSKPVKGTALVGNQISGKFGLFSNDKNYDHLKKPDQADKELDNLEFRMFEIDLIGDMTFCIIEPLRNGTGNELKNLESALMNVKANDEQSLLVRALDNMSKRRETFERLQFPKFKFENDIDLKGVLSSAGLEHLFSNKAALSEISPIPMMVSKARHQAFIELDKNGLKGGALTRVVISKLSMFIAHSPIQVIVKNPFLFLVRYKSLTLFMGHVVQV